MSMSVPARLAAVLLALVCATSVCASSAFAQSATRVRLLSTPNPSQLGQSVTLTAEVDGLGGGTPTGNVAFKDGATTLGQGALAAPGAGQQTLALGSKFACALTDAGGVKCWGFNGGGRLGDGTTVRRNTPVAVTGLATGVVAVATGSFHACALTAAGAVLCWGNNFRGELGDGTTDSRSTPVPVVGLSSGVVAIFAGLRHSCAVTGAGAVLCWGENANGELGDGTTTPRLTPTPVVGLSSGVVAGAAGVVHSCALTGAGAVRCWGNNLRGQLGDGTGTNRLSPVAVTSLGNAAIAITAGDAHTCAVVGSGAAFCWGANNVGQLGDGTTTNRLSPVAVSGLAAGTAAIVAGGGHTCALRTTGAVLCWGRNDIGQLGDGTQTNRPVPTAVLGLANGRIAIGAGDEHSCALRSDGALQCWGNNDQGQIGDGTFTQRQSAVDVVSFAGLPRARARLATTAISGGFRALTAEFAGDAAHAGSTSTLRQLVNPAGALATTTTLAASPNPSNARQTVTFTATVRSDFGVTSGLVMFLQDGAPVATVGLDENGVAVFTATPSPAGSREWRAEYAPQGPFSGSLATLTQVVIGLPTQTTLSVSPNPSTFGQTVTVTATVGAGAEQATGEVAFLLDGAPFATAPLSGGTASVTATPPVGSHEWRAEYAQQGDFAASVATATNVVNKATTTTTLTSSANPSVFSQFVDLIANVTSSTGTPTGQVEFLVGGTVLQTVTLDAGQARIDLSTRPVGAQTFSARYVGTANFSDSSSTGLVQTINKALARVTLSAAPNPINPGQQATLVANVSPVAPATAIPTGSILFRQNGASIGSVALDAVGDASRLTAPLPFGAYQFAALYGGSNEFNAASRGINASVDFRLGLETRVNRTTLGPQAKPSVAPNGNGEAMAVWESATATGQPNAIRARGILANGTLAPAEIGVSGVLPGTGAPKVSSLSNGDYVVVWHVDGASGREINMRRMSPAGAFLDVARRVNTVAVGDQASPVVTGLNGGGYVVAWQSAGEDGSGQSIIAQRFTNAGVRIGRPVIVNTTTAGDQTAPAITSLTNGGYVIGWSGPATGGFSAFFQRFNANGVKLGGERRIDSSPMTAAPKLALAPLALSGFITTWHEPETDAASPTDVFARRFDSSGAPDGAAYPVPTVTAGRQSDPTAALLDSGSSHVVAWTTPDANLDGVAAQAFTPSGVRIESQFLANTQQTGGQRAPVIAQLGAGAAAGKSYVILWDSLSADTSQGGILMQRFIAP